MNQQLELFAQTHEILLLLIILALVIWTVVWKGIALWKSALLKDKWWFIAILIVNTIGVLEILYIFVFSKKKLSPTDETKITAHGKDSQ